MTRRGALRTVGQAANQLAIALLVEDAAYRAGPKSYAPEQRQITLALQLDFAESVRLARAQLDAAITEHAGSIASELGQA